MIARRRAASATGPSVIAPSASSPRWTSVALIRARRSGSAGPVEEAIPQIPHTAGHSTNGGHRPKWSAMRLQELGESGIRVSRVGLGCNNFGRRLDLEGTRAVVERALAVSNFSVEQLDEAVEAGPVAALQNRYSLLERAVEEDVLPRCRELGVSFIPYFPLSSGLLTGKYRRGQAPPPGSRLESRRDALSDKAFDRVERLEEFAAAHGRTLLELAIAGLASQPAVVSVIAGATSPEQVRENAAAAGWELSEGELEDLLRL